MKLQRVLWRRYKISLPRALPNDATNRYLKSRGLSYHPCEWLMMWRMVEMVAGSMMTTYNLCRTLGMQGGCASMKIKSV
jgi:hypothetical protein